tara:strand:+ start:139 stop:915 length:777 start_codon:yes stop_codon:yes gene_type:complete
MAASIKFNIEKFNRFLSVYEQSQANFAGKRALTKLGQRLKGSQGLAQRYKRIFDRPVPFTTNSTFTVQRGLELEVGVKDRVEKGNPAGKYLFPPIGVGSGKAYDTQFTQYLRNRGLIDNADYPFPITKNPLVRTNKYGNVTQTTYGNTKKALGKTRGKGKFSGGNSKITDARVLAFRKHFVVKKKDGTSKTYQAGIYRENRMVGSNKTKLSPLFLYDNIPTQKKGGSGGTKVFPEIVKDFADAQLMKIWLREIKQLAK